MNKVSRFFIRYKVVWFVLFGVVVVFGGLTGWIIWRGWDLRDCRSFVVSKVDQVEAYGKRVFRLENKVVVEDGESGGAVKGVSSEAVGVGSGDVATAPPTLLGSGTVEDRLKLLEVQFDGFLLREKSNQDGIEALKKKLEQAISEVQKSNALLVEQNKTLVLQLENLQASGGSAVATTGSQSSGVAGTSVGIVNINTATETELDGLDGVGPSIAKRIVEYRVANGGFKTIEGIMEVSGIGESIFSKIKDKIRV